MRESRAIPLLLVLAATFAIARPVQTRTSNAVDLATLPYTLGQWNGIDDSMDAETAAQLGADAYVTRTYTNGAEPPVGFYAAYYASQRPGVSIHSPLHCLPGTGWEPLDVATVSLTSGGASGDVRRMVVRKNLDRAVVIYWYQLHGRIVANEITSKLYLLADSLRFGRRDAALVRLVVPVLDQPDAAAAHGRSFARELLPRLAPLF